MGDRPEDAGREAVRAGQAKLFYTRYQNDARAVEARRLEIIHLINAVRLGDTALEGRLDGAVKQFRSDSSIPASLRAEIASTFDLPRTFRSGQNRADRLAAMARAARELCAEFPRERQGYESLLTIARLSDDPQYRAILEELSPLPVPDGFEEIVATLLARQKLVGANYADLLNVPGAAKRFPAPQAGQIIVLYTWDSRNPASVQLARELSDRLDGRANLVGLNWDTTEGAAHQAIAANHLAGAQIYDPEGNRGEIARSLMLNNPSIVYVIDAAGCIRDVRTQDNLNIRLTSFGL
jgi:hypothetical protein